MLNFKLILLILLHALFLNSSLLSSSFDMDMLLEQLEKIEQKQSEIMNSQLAQVKSITDKASANSKYAVDVYMDAYYGIR